MMRQLLIFSAAFSFSLSAIVPTSNDYTHSLELIENEVYHVFWKYDDTTITFEVHAKTLGWVGFGLSPNGDMIGSDVTIIWVKDGQSFFTDRHAVGYYEPLVDDSQDWTLISAQESDDYTIVKMTRKHVTGDPDDLCITPGTVRLVYSFHPEDTEPLQEHTMRGSKSVLLLSPPREEPTLPPDAFYYDIKNSDGRPESDEDTTYWCEAFKPPPLDKKHHIVMIEPIIEEGHEWLVHHMLIYACNFDISPYTPEEAHGFNGHCEMRDQRMYALHRCSAIFYGWAVGAGKFWFPDHAGIPIGDQAYPALFKLETHYDNPNLTKDIVDHSGLRIWMTPTLRDHDAAVLETGMRVSDNLLVPPTSEGYLTTGVCHGDCIAEAISRTDEGNIKIFASMLHSHLAGVGLRVRHVRDGTELPPIAEDNNYDFNFQEFRFLHKEITVKSGDHLFVECAYQTADRTKVTMGGLRTKDEMCLSYMLYYPRIPLSDCQSSPSVWQLSKFLEEEGYETECHYFEGDPNCHPYITEPQEYYGSSIFDAAQWLDWNEDQRDLMQGISIEGEMGLRCKSSVGEGFQANRRMVQVPVITDVYEDDSIYAMCPSVFDQFNFTRVNKGSTNSVSIVILTISLMTIFAHL